MGRLCREGERPAARATSARELAVASACMPASCLEARDLFALLGSASVLLEYVPLSLADCQSCEGVWQWLNGLQPGLQPETHEQTLLSPNTAELSCEALEPSMALQRHTQHKHKHSHTV